MTYLYLDEGSPKSVFYVICLSVHLFNPLLISTAIKLREASVFLLFCLFIYLFIFIYSIITFLRVCV